MNLYLAPLEGITGYIYRNALNDIFGGVDKFYAPFITPPVKRELATKEIRELCREHNEGIDLVPQVLTANASDFNLTKEVLRDMGYGEININLGCPSKTVTTKGRGAGALQYPDKLDEFLYGVFESGEDKVSIKTRIGVEEKEEFERLLEIYNKYPIMELTIHPRLMNQAYKGLADREVFFDAASKYQKPLCYNGDINSRAGYEDFLLNSRKELTDSVLDKEGRFGAIMIGRGALRNPAVFREIRGGQKASHQEMENFLNRILEEYQSILSGETPVLFKMKEIWSYLGLSYKECEKAHKKLMKAKSISEYKIYAKELLRSEMSK